VNRGLGTSSKESVIFDPRKRENINFRVIEGLLSWRSVGCSIGGRCRAGFESLDGIGIGTNGDGISVCISRISSPRDIVFVVKPRDKIEEGK